MVVRREDVYEYEPKCSHKDAVTLAPHHHTAVLSVITHSRIANFLFCLFFLISYSRVRVSLLEICLTCVSVLSIIHWFHLCYMCGWGRHGKVTR